MKSYFYGDERKKIDDLLAETTSIDGETCAIGAGGARGRGAADPSTRAEVQPARQDVAALRVPQGRSGRGVPSAEGRARRRARRRVHLPRAVRLVLARPGWRRRRSKRSCRSAGARTAMGARTRFAPCALADMGRCVAPCDGRVDPERYGELVRRLVSSLTSPGGLLGALERRMAHLAEQERYEEAGLVRDRLRALADALAREPDRRVARGRGARSRCGTAPGRRSASSSGSLVRGDDAEPLAGAVRARAGRRALGRARLVPREPPARRIVRPAARRARGRRSGDRPHPDTGPGGRGGPDVDSLATGRGP